MKLVGRLAARSPGLRLVVALEIERHCSADEILLREHLRRLELRASEERDREGYSRQSQADADVQSWESEATWPEE